MAPAGKDKKAIESQEHYSSLLRLFKSEYFDSKLSISYLFRFPKSVGIQNYICSELQKYPESDIEYLLPQICHIIISRPQDSACIEGFITSLCWKSSHMAILTLWYLESYLDEMHRSYNIHSESFQLTKRLYEVCKAIVFADAVADQKTIEPSKIISANYDYDANVSAHIPPSVVGIGLIMGSFAAPFAHKHAQSMVINQSKQPRFQHTLEDDHSIASFNEEQSSEIINPKALLSSINALIPTSSPSLEDLSQGSAFSFRNFLRKTSYPQSFKKSSPTASDTSKSDAKSIDREKLKMSHYFHSEMQFIMALVDISERLVSFPKHERQTSLIAELALLNHNLPANVCIPLWCPADMDYHHHHQICRIALSDCVVLNSADRVPYLMLVEVIESETPITKLEVPSEEIVKPVTSGEFLPINIASDSSASETVKNQSEKSNNSADYHLKVISRRQSITDTGLENDQELKKSEKLKKLEEYSDRMRTAAVMLAQLYQQQQRDQHKLNMKTSLRKSQSGILTPRRSENVRHQSAPSSPGSLDRSNSASLKNDFEEIRSRVLKEMATIEAERLEMMTKSIGENEQMDEILLNDSQPYRASMSKDEEDPSASVFKEPWEVKKQRIQQTSPYGNHPNWKLYSVIVKSGADLRQEQLALQLIRDIQGIWQSFDLPLWVYPFRILITSSQSGLIETIPDSVSIHSIKKEGYASNSNQPGFIYSLYDHFIQQFGPAGSERFAKAQDNFIKSLAAYSIITYLLQIRDRHNGNILLDLHGHVTHIDFGFMLMNSPGSVGFELAPFKLPQEYIDVMDGLQSDAFKKFRELVKQGFLALRKRHESITMLVKIMEKDSKLPCFTGITTKPNAVPLASPSVPVRADIEVPAKPVGGDKFPVTDALKDRFQLSLTDEAFCTFIDGLIDSACNNMFTKLYDSFQYYANGIL